MDERGYSGMKVVKYVLTFVVSFLLCVSVYAKDNQVKLYLFYGKECPHCAAEETFLEGLQKENQNLEVIAYEVWHNKENENLMNDVKAKLEKESPYVPFTVIGDISFTGFNSSFEKAIKEAITTCSKSECIDIVSLVKNGTEVEEIIVAEKKQDTTMNVPILGEIQAQNVSLPILAIVLGLVDGFNPCAMWVLLFLISMLIGNNNRKRMIGLGTLFLVTSAIIYALFMVAWLKIMLTMTQISMIKIAIAIVALLGAGWNLYSFYKGVKSKEVGCEVVNQNKRKKIIDKIRKFTAEKSFLLAAVGIITLAISVNFVELACSAGWPLVFTEILAMNDLNVVTYALYILLYILFYLFDDLIIFLIAVITLKVTGISNKYTKYSHLIGGILMLAIGLLMLFKPEWLMMNF